MGIIQKGETLLQKAKRLLKKIIQQGIKNNDNFSLVLTSDLNKIKFYNLINEKKDLIDAIENTRISGLKNNIFTSLKDAEKLLDKSTYTKKIIYFISDMQTINFYQNQRYIYKYIKIKYPIFFIKLPISEYKNSAIVNTYLPLKLNFKNDTLFIQPTIKNFSSKKNNLIIKTYLNNEAINQKSLTINPFQKQKINIAYKLTSTGYQGGYTEITDGDDLLFDNTYYFTINVPSKVNIAIIDKNNELFYIVNAINPAYVLNKKSQSYIKIFEYKSIPTHLKNTLLIFSYDSFSHSDISKLKNLLYNNNILIFPSNKLNINNFNGVLSKSDIISGTIERIQKSTTKPFNIVYIDFSHPIFKIFQDLKIFQNTKIFSYYKLNIGEKDYNVNIMAKVSKDPGILEYTYTSPDELHTSKIILFTFLPDKKNTDIIYSPNFPPLIHQIIKYLLNQGEEEIYNQFLVGQTLDDIFEIMAIKPTEVIPLNATKDESIVNNIIIKPGLYKIGNKIIAVNLNYNESNLETLSIDDIKKNYKGLKIISVKNKKEIETEILLSFYIKPLWKHFLVIALFLIILEICIANEILKNLSKYNIKEKIKIFFKKS